MVKGPEQTKLKYMLTNIKLEYETICSKHLSDKVNSMYSTGKSFMFDNVVLDKIENIIKDKDTSINIKVNAQRRSMKGILLLFLETFTDGSRDSEKCLPRPEESLCNYQRLAQHDLQQRNRKRRHEGRGQPLLHKRKI